MPAMPIITVSCLPKLRQRKLKRLFEDIVEAVKRVPELGIRGAESVLVLFPADLMTFGLGTEIVVQVTNLFIRSCGHEFELRMDLAEKLGNVIFAHFPKANVKCLVYPYEQPQGFWQSPAQE